MRHELVQNQDKIIKYGKKGKAWVEKYHDIKNVSKQLYKYYGFLGLQ